MIKIKVEKETTRFIKKCLDHNINLKNIKYNKEFITTIIDEKDFEMVKRINYYSNIEILEYYGIKKIKKHLKKYIFDYMLLIIFIILICIQSNIIIKVEIKHENKELKNKINEIIKIYGIKKYTFGKTLNELNKISDDIIYNNKDFIDWISINKEGMTYKISVEERINADIPKIENQCHIISLKDAIITKIISESGTSLVEKGQHVHKNEILLSGEIKLNDEIKKNVCANGKIYGETWYKIHISKPLNYKNKTYTNNKKYNISLNNKYLFKNKFENYEEKVIFKIKNFKIVKLIEYKIENKKYSYDEAKKIAIEDSINKLLKEIKEKPTIISQNVLKETKNNSKIELDIFISIEQLISKRITYEVGEEDGNTT